MQYSGLFLLHITSLCRPSSARAVTRLLAASLTPVHVLLPRCSRGGFLSLDTPSTLEQTQSPNDDQHTCPSTLKDPKQAFHLPFPPLPESPRVSRNAMETPIDRQTSKQCENNVEHRPSTPATANTNGNASQKKKNSSHPGSSRSRFLSLL